MSAPAAMPVSSAPPFISTIRTRTQAVHDEVNGSSYVTALLEGRLDRAEYAALVSQHFVLYSAIEEITDRLAADPVAAPFVDRDIYRVRSLEADLGVLLGPDWLERLHILPATHRLVARLREIADWPGGVIAHHYVRYLGDMSGGRIVGANLAKTYGIARGSDGISFYHFATVPKPPLYKRAYYDLLEQAPWSAVERERVVDEVLVAFQLNGAILDELAENLPRTSR